MHHKVHILNSNLIKWNPNSFTSSRNQSSNPIYQNHSNVERRYTVGLYTEL